MSDPEKLSDNPEEQLRMENELLKLKLQAELGAHFGMSAEGLPPEVEQQFLRQIMAFHQGMDDQPPVSLRDYLEQPGFLPAASLDESGLEAAWDRLTSVLAGKRIVVDFLAEYPLALMYDFIVGELFDHEMYPPVPGQHQVFIYEEFHPNHPYDMKRRVEEFMTGFFEHSLDTEQGGCLAETLVTPEGGQLSPQELAEKVARFHGLFDSIKSWDYAIEEVHVDEPASEDAPMMGFVEGAVRYTVVRIDGREQEVVGPFKCYMHWEMGWWNMFHFYIHGFSWR